MKTAIAVCTRRSFLASASLIPFWASRLVVGAVFAVLIPAVVWSADPRSIPSAPTGPAQSQEEDECPAVATLAMGDLYALVVGVSKYGNPQVPHLNVAAKDAKDFARFLESQQELFKSVKVKLLTDDQATKKEVEKFLFYEVRKAGKDDTIFLFLSGHGAIDPKRPGEFFFLTHDTDPDFLELSAVNMSGLRFLKNLDCPRVVLIADACHAGGFSKWGTKAVMPMKQFIHDISSSSGRVVITSSRPEELSLENAQLGNSLFTHNFLQGIAGAADFDGNGVVTIHEVYRYVYNRTKAESEGAQHPQFEGTVEGEFPISVSSKVQNKAPTRLELFSDPPAAEVFVGGRLVGKTNPDGSMYLKFLPMDRPLPVVLRKEGWQEKTVGPFVFSKDLLQVSTKVVKLDPAVASLEIKTVPGGAAVKVNGKDVGKTGNDGRMIIHGLQVSVPHTIELQSRGFADESVVVTIPVAQVGKKFKADDIKLSKAAPAATPQPSPRGSDRTEEPRASSIPRESPRVSEPPASRPSRGDDSRQNEMRLGL